MASNQNFARRRLDGLEENVLLDGNEEVVNWVVEIDYVTKKRKKRG